MPTSLYLVNPAGEIPTYFGAEVFEAQGLRPATFIADLALPTLAAMLPEGFEVRVCDEHLEPVDFDDRSDFVGLTGKITQWTRMRAIAERFRARGRTVIIGGPLATLSPEMVRPHCDILVTGEIEDIADAFFADLARGRWKAEYRGTSADLSRTPLPRWDLYPNDRAIMGTMQTSRGCPFECEFCDAIQYLGRAQRHKPIPRVIEELENLYRHGYRSVFLADDNFPVFRARAKELLVAVRDWNRRQTHGHVGFSAQVSIDAARDVELVRLLAEAGVRGVFIGIETPNEESLRETKKRQNLRIDMLDRVQVFLDHGLQVTGGMIVGFDADGADIFRRQYEFAMAAPIPVFSVGALVAPAATPLHARLKKAGRLVADGSEVAANPWMTNIVPLQMSRDALIDGVRRLALDLYQPEALLGRIRTFAERLGPSLSPGSPAGAPPRSVWADYRAVVAAVSELGADEAAMVREAEALTASNPNAFGMLPGIFLRYAQIRHMYAYAGITEEALR
jgi:hypothetical protein